MTLKRSFLGSMLENLKRRRATIALTVVALFLTYPIIFLLVLSSAVDDIPDNRRMVEIINYAGGYFGYNTMIIVVFGVLGVILAFQAFGFLHKKNKMDLYNSVPVSYNRRFLVIVINSILILLVSTAACFVLCLIIMGIYHVFTVNFAWRLFLTMSTGVLFGMGMFSITALAICLTGNTIVAICGTVIFALYEIAGSAMLRYYMEKFFLTYTQQSVRGFSLTVPKFSIIYYMSEIIDAGEIYNYIFNYSKISLYTSSAEGHTIFFSLVMMFVITIVTLLLTWLCFKKRPSEAAGRSMAFPKTKRVIKYMIMIFATLVGAELFHRMDESYYIVGGVLTAVMGCVMIEIIYEGDIRSALKHLVDIPIVLAVATIIFGIFSNDILGYDSYIPEKASLKKVAFAPANSYIYGYHFKIGEDGILSLIEASDYMLNFYFDDDESMGVILNVAKNHADNNEDLTKHVTMKYVLKNGQVKYRQYWISENSYKEIIDLLESKEKFVEESFQGIYELRDYVKKVGIIDTSGNWINVSDEDVSEILDAYTKDMESIKRIVDLREKKTIGIVSLGVVLDNGTLDYRDSTLLYRDSYRYPIYDDFDNTIACLEDKGLFYADYLKNRTIESVNIYQFKIDEDGNFMCDDRAIASSEERSEREILVGNGHSVFGSSKPVYNRRWFLPAERENEIREIVDYGFSGLIVDVSSALTEEYDTSEDNVSYMVVIDWKNQNGDMHTDDFNIMPKNIGRLEEIIRLYGKEE